MIGLGAGYKPLCRACGRRQGRAEFRRKVRHANGSLVFRYYAACRDCRKLRSILGTYEGINL